MMHLNSSMKHRFLGSLAACAGLLAVTLPSHAGDAGAARADTSRPAYVVRFGDLNLNSRDGAKALYARLSRAAERACGYQPNHQELWRNESFDACYSATLDDAVRKVGSAQVRAVHREVSRVG